MKWGMVFHMVIGALMFTNSAIIADSTDIKALDTVNQFNSDSNAQAEGTSLFTEFQGRFLDSDHSVIYISLMLALVFAYCAWNLLERILE